MTKLDLALRLARESGRSAAEAADLLDEAVQKILTSAQGVRGPLCAVNNKGPQVVHGPLCAVNKSPKEARAPSRATSKAARASSRGYKPKGNSPDLAPQSESAARELPGGRRRGPPSASNKSPAGAPKRPEGRPAKKAAKLDGS
jgi:hypothetical protein